MPSRVKLSPAIHSRKLQRLGDLVLRQRRRIGAIGLDHLGDPPAHRGPVVDGRGRHRYRRAQARCAGARALSGVSMRSRVDVDQAFAAGALRRAPGSPRRRARGTVPSALRATASIGWATRRGSMALLRSARPASRSSRKALIVVDHLENGDLAVGGSPSPNSSSRKAAGSVVFGRCGAGPGGHRRPLPPRERAAGGSASRSSATVRP